MPNHYFRFKEFIVEQGNCGMKVTTEACLFGVLYNVKNLVSKIKVLDIGAGTGLLSLMSAQRLSNAHITAVEVDELAYQQMTTNVRNSKWSERIDVIHSSIQSYKAAYQIVYDLIICNPPFFTKHQIGDDKQKAKALHAVLLPHSELASCVNQLLSSEGEFSIILPEYEAENFNKFMMTHGLFINKRINVFNKKNDHRKFRVVSTYSRKKCHIQDQSFYIRNNSNDYTSDFKNLLKDYYLHL